MQGNRTPGERAPVCGSANAVTQKATLTGLLLGIVVMREMVEAKDGEYDSTQKMQDAHLHCFQPRRQQNNFRQ